MPSGGGIRQWGVFALTHASVFERPLAGPVGFLAASILVLFLVVPPARAEFQSVSLDNDLSAEIEDAVAEDKRLVVMFDEEGCPWCMKMRERIFPHPKVQAYYGENFILINQDIKGDLEVTTPDGGSLSQKQFAQKLRIRGTPTFIYFNVDGSVAARITGYQDVDTFVATGRYVHEGVYASGKSLARWLMEQQ